MSTSSDGGTTEIDYTTEVYTEQPTGTASHTPSSRPEWTGHTGHAEPTNCPDDEKSRFRKGLLARQVTGFWREREDDTRNLQDAAESIHPEEGASTYHEYGPFRVSIIST